MNVCFCVQNIFYLLLNIKQWYFKSFLFAGICIPGLTETPVTSVIKTMNCLLQGSSGRVTGSTAMNNQSSRSHAIFTLTIHQQKLDDINSAMTAKFHLVDLAGSERYSKKFMIT